MTLPAPRHTTRTDRRLTEIRSAALSAFLDGGYLGTTVDEIAAIAHTSKRTVYQHFGDKEGLFRAVIRGTIAPMQRSLENSIQLATTQDARESLRALVRSLVTIVVTPQVVQLRRVVIAETDRFPDLAAEWYQLGPAQTIDRLEAYLDRLARSGELSIADHRTAAEQLLWLSISAPLNRLMFQPSGSMEAAGDLECVADAAFETFWRAFRTPSAE